MTKNVFGFSRHGKTKSLQSRLALLSVPALLLAVSSMGWAKINAHQPYEPQNPMGASHDEQWEKVPHRLQGTFGGIDAHYPRNQPPQIETVRAWSPVAWRGQRTCAQIVLFSSDEMQQVRFSHTALQAEIGNVIPESAIKVNFLRYTLSDDGSQGCGKTEENKTLLLVPDIIDTAGQLELPAQSVRPLWVAIDVPAEAKSGLYKGQITISAKAQNKINFDIQLEVLPLLLPKPAQWQFYLDLWQNPWSVARYHDVEPWSKQHWLLLDPLVRMLAQAGQKCITTTIVHAAWGGQTYDTYGSMVEWIRKPDASWSFDYEIFDLYIEFCQARGINKVINCYSLAPWGSNIRYLDQATGDYVTVKAEPGSEMFKKLWMPFLIDFVKHLKRKGWLGKTAIAMDERPDETMQKVISLIKETSPKLMIALAGEYHAKLDADIQDLCIYVNGHNENTFKAVQSRSLNKRVTTFYVCCSNDKPNNFTYSPPAESAWIGWYAAAKGFDGFLRWAYNSWSRNPLYDTRHTTFQAGDCFMVYPGARSAVKFERLREGIQDYEKIQILKKKLKAADLEKLNAILSEFTYPQPQSCAQVVNKAKQDLLQLSRKASAK
jgi:hypothetical protein